MFNNDLGMFGWPLGLTVGFFSIFALLGIALIALKGYALWHAARRGERGWFIALLVVNTLGILELIYLLSRSIIGKKKNSENGK